MIHGRMEYNTPYQKHLNISFYYSVHFLNNFFPAERCPCLILRLICRFDLSVFTQEFYNYRRKLVVPVFLPSSGSIPIPTVVDSVRFLVS